jgi:hypothetical protein
MVGEPLVLPARLRVTQEIEAPLGHRRHVHDFTLVRLLDRPSWFAPGAGAVGRLVRRLTRAGLVAGAARLRRWRLLGVQVVDERVVRDRF